MCWCSKVYKINAEEQQKNVITLVCKYDEPKKKTKNQKRENRVKNTPTPDTISFVCLFHFNASLFSTREDNNFAFLPLFC